MLEYLRIRDLALIEDMALEFGPGMNVLTGETGAGKTFILKAINFLLGEKLGLDLVRPGSAKAQVEAVFARPEGELILRRELVADTGRSRFFLNGDLSSQETARELRASLILHAGQHGQQRLLQPGYQAQLIDAFLADQQLLEKRQQLLKQCKEISEQRLELQRKIGSLQDRRELLEMQQKEIERVKPKPDEEEKLEELKANLRSYEDLRLQYGRGYAIMLGEEGPGLLEQLSGLEVLLEQIEAPEQDLAPALEALRNFKEEARELSNLFRKVPAPANLGADPDKIESRLYALAQLKRKLNRTLPQILDLQQEIEENLSFLDLCGLDLQQLTRQEKQAATELVALLEQLNAARHKAADDFCQALENELRGLGFSEQVRVLPEFTPQQLWPALEEVPAALEDKVRLLWAPNPGQPPQALDRIASGGELSRFLLAVTGLQARAETATLIFDEVDAGVGGHTLNRVAERLESLAQRRQMLLITHWPQLASRAHRHFQVSKDIIANQTYTRCRSLQGPEIKEELARMAGEE